MKTDSIFDFGWLQVAHLVTKIPQRKNSTWTHTLHDFNLSDLRPRGQRRGGCSLWVCRRYSKLLAPDVCFVELVLTGLWTVWAEQHGQYNRILPIPAKKESNVPKLKSSKALLSNLYSVAGRKQVNYGCVRHYPLKCSCISNKILLL